MTNKTNCKPQSVLELSSKKLNCKPDYHINIIYCGGSCISHYREYNQTFKLFMSDYSESHMIVASSDWVGYNDTIKYRESKYYCMISNGGLASVPKPDNINKYYGDECVIVKITNDRKP